MSGRPRRSAHISAEKKMAESAKKEIVEEQEDDDQPPPILEREASCGENEDTDGDGKEEEEADSTSPGSKKSEGAGIEPQGTLLAALSHVFATEKKTNGKKYTTVRHPNAVFAKAAIVRPVSSTLSPSTSNPQIAVATTSMKSSYGTPPPIPRALRGLAGNSVAVKRSLPEKEKETVPLPQKRTSLVAYNGGRAGEQFRKLPEPSTSSSILDLHSMLRDQSPVRIQVSAGGQSDESNSVQEALDVASLQKDTISSVVRNASNHNVLLGSMILNGLNSLQERNTEDYQNFSTDLFALIIKYRLQ